MTRQALIMSLLAGPALAGWNAASAEGAAVEVAFSAAEVAIMRAYYQETGGGTKAHGAKRSKGLPPGIAKNLRRGKPLPPGIAKRYLPADLHAALPPPPRGHERIIAAGKILLVEIATQIVRDVLSDVLLDA